MYVVKRPFKNYGKVYTAGTVFDSPVDIKRFNNKVAERKIIKITNTNLLTLVDYFKAKHGVDIVPAIKAIIKQKAEERKAAASK